MRLFALELNDKASRKQITLDKEEVELTSDSVANRNVKT